MYLLDTNVISELRKSGTDRLDQNVRRWADSVSAEDLYLSVITIAELEMGVLSLERRDPQQATPLRIWLNHLVKMHFQGRILNITPQVAMQYAQINVPNRLAVMDGLIAATAMSNNLIVVTRNTADFPTVRTINPFEF